MSSPGFADTIDLAPRPSVRALTLLFVLHVAILALLVLSLRAGFALALMACAVAWSWLRLRRHPVFGYGPRALTRLIWHADGRWTIHDAGGAREAELHGSSIVLPGLMVLNFRIRGVGRRSRALLGDEVEAQALRRLRARLRAGGW